MAIILQVNQARKGFRPISASQNFLGIVWELLGFLGDFLGIFWEFFGNSLGMHGWEVLIWEFFGIFLRILLEFLGNSIGSLLEFF